MFYRRKLILALLQLFDGQLDKIRLQKLLFLFANKQAKAAYDFIPYKFGCYSYSANADMTAMVTRGFLTEDEKTFAKQLNTGDLPHPDLLIRTGGERRISNFFLWQLAYTELYFSDVYWPDFTTDAFDSALEWFALRERRFGQTSKQLLEKQDV